MNENYEYTDTKDAKDSTSLLSMAQRVHDEYIEKGKRTASEITREASLEAESLLQEAEQEAERIIQDAREEEASLRDRIDSLKEVEYKYRLALKDAADNTLTYLEELTNNSEVGVSTN